MSRHYPEYHPEADMLLEYSAGNLAWAQSLAVSTHIQLCPHCRQQHQQLNRVGGNLLDQCAPQPVANSALQRLMDRIETSEDPDQSEEPAKPVQPARRIGNDPALADLPQVIHKVVKRNLPLKWRRVSPALTMTRLKTAQDKYEVAFHRICRGGRIAEHDHRGEEIIVVLHGSFSDADGVYKQGDFLVRRPGEVHRPIATEDQECLCLSVVEAPVAVTGVLGWLVNPFLSFRAS
ncbi:ChrR family anti-sigma-E factor [Microbulbifer sp. SA54]|uniref:ChrR family anti-sigma-E factor n=1 Tax=Microbulbifer sp. SA54 TaxID=3401577 RepID=UPI003AAE3FAC